MLWHVEFTFSVSSKTIFLHGMLLLKLKYSSEIDMTRLESIFYIVNLSSYPKRKRNNFAFFHYSNPPHTISSRFVVMSERHLTLEIKSSFNTRAPFCLKHPVITHDFFLPFSFYKVQERVLKWRIQIERVKTVMTILFYQLLNYTQR